MAYTDQVTDEDLARLFGSSVPKTPVTDAELASMFAKTPVTDAELAGLFSNSAQKTPVTDAELVSLFGSPKKSNKQQEQQQKPVENNPIQNLSMPKFEFNNPLQGNNIADLIPNVFARSTPANYQGLLGAGVLTPEQVAQTQRSANIQGLLSAGLALAQGMGKTGARRSAAQNILSALGAGFAGSGGAYQQGLQNIGLQNQLVTAKLQQEKAIQDRAAIERALQDPRIANDPMLVAYIRANPNEALKMLAESLPIQAAISGGQPQAPQLGQPQTAQVEGQQQTQAVDGVLPGIEVTGKRGIEGQLVDRKNQIIAENQRLAAIPSKVAQDRIKNNFEQITAIDKQLDRFAVEKFDFTFIESQVPAQFKNEVKTLQQMAETGAISGNDLTQRLQDVQKRAVEFVTKKTDYTNQDRRVAAAMFEGRGIEELAPAELMQLQNKLDAMDIQKRKAGATTINMPSESERTAGFLTNRVVNSLNQLQTVVGTNPTAASPNFSSEAVKFLTGSEYLKNLTNPETRQQVEAAQLEILDAALTLGTGAAYTREQLENYRRSYFPQLGDKPATVKDKQDRLKSLIDSAMIKSGRAAPTTQGGTTPMFDMNAIDAELSRRKGK